MCLWPIAELNDFKARRITHFRKNFVDLVELEVKHAKVSQLSDLWMVTRLLDLYIFQIVQCPGTYTSASVTIDRLGC